MRPILVPPVLRDRIASIQLASQPVGGSQQVLPTGGVVLGFQLSGRVGHGGSLLAPIGVTGVLHQARRFDYHEDTTSVLVRLRPEAGSCLGPPADALTGQSVGLEQLLDSRRLREIAGRIPGMREPVASIALLQALLLALPYHCDLLVAAAISRMERQHGERDIAATAAWLGISTRQLGRRFRAQVGVSPMRYLALRRFEAAVALLRQRKPLAQVAMDAGYYDQSHLARNVRTLACMSPAGLARRLR